MQRLQRTCFWIDRAWWQNLTNSPCQFLQRLEGISKKSLPAYLRDKYQIHPNTEYLHTIILYIHIYIYMCVYMYTVIYQTCTEYVQSFPCTLRSCTCRKSKLHASCWLGHITCSTAGSKLILSCITTRPVVWGHLINYNQLTLKKTLDWTKI